MRNVNKTDSPDCLSEICSQLPWQEFQGKCKDTVGERALHEQNGLCIYCERKLNYTEWSAAGHIEHIKPQGESFYPQLRYCYRNLTISCNGKPSDPLERSAYVGQEFSSCGHYRQSCYEPRLFINPVCSEDISVMIDWNKETAELVPRELYKERVNYMIGILNINNHYLCNARKKAFQELMKVVEKYPSKRDHLFNEIREVKTEFATFLTSRIS